MQYSRYSSTAEGEGEQVNVIVQQAEPARPSRRALRATSFKDLMDFVDKKEVEIKEMLTRKSEDAKSKTHLTTQVSQGQTS